MNDQTQSTEIEEVVASAPTRIRPNLANYVPAKSSGGKRSHRRDDLTARVLSGKSLEDVINGAKAFNIDASKWAHLNPGQQRMLVGNALRSQLNAKKDPISEQGLVVVFGDPVPEFDAAAHAAEVAAREKAKADKAAVKAAGSALDAASEPVPVATEQDGDEAEARVEEGRKARRNARAK